MWYNMPLMKQKQAADHETMNTTNNVTLLPLISEYADTMHTWICDPCVRDNIGFHREASLESTENWIRNAIKDSSIHAYAIFEEDVHIGNVVLDQVLPELQTARLSIYIGEANARGRGIGKKALQLALSEAFNRLGIQKVWLTVHEQNINAIRAYYRAGFSLEGIHRKEFLLHGRRINALYMGILVEEFFQITETVRE